MAITRCGRCGRVLITPECVQAGFGRVCYRKSFGKSFPRKERTPHGSGKVTVTPRKSKSHESQSNALPLFAADIVCRREPSGRVVTNVPHRIRHHSPDGFEWGYGGSGPSEFALNILSLYVGANRAWPLHQDFKRDFIENMAHEGGTILKEKIVNWIEAHEAQE